MTAPDPQCAVIGAGPAGFYCAQALLQGDERLRVTLIERLPAAYGLARYGVAPDHLKLKQVCAVFEGVLKHPRLELIGHVDVPRDVPLAFLREQFDAVVLATGAPVPRRLGIPGEDLAGSYSAAEFVAWYNGHPAAASLEPDLTCHAAVVVGQGNVALDVARVLSMPDGRRVGSDMAAHALQALASSHIRSIHVVGRRGPWHTRFSPKELRELESLENVCLRVHAAGGLLAPTAPDGIDDAARTAGEFFLRHAGAPGSARECAIHFHFGYVPRRLDGGRTVAEAQFDPVQPGRAPLVLPCGLVVRSIGTHSAPFDGLPVDPLRGGLANQAGRALGSAGEVLAGLYVTGWARRGATGVIGTNRDDGIEVAAAVLQDLSRSPVPPRGGAGSLRAWLQARGHATIDAPGWLRVDAAERAAGQRAGRPRLKFVATADLLAAARLSQAESSHP